MALRYDPALVSGLCREIGSRWTGRRVDGFRLNRETREAWIVFAEGPDEERAIGFLLHPSRGFIVSGAGPRSSIVGSERRIGFRRLFLTAVWSPDDERLLVLDLAGGGAQDSPGQAQSEITPVYRLFVELHTNQWNAVLARGTDDRVEAVLWSRAAGGRSLRPGATYARPEGARSWAAGPPPATEWLRLLESVPPEARREVLLRSAAWTSSLNVDWILGEAAHGDASAESGTEGPLARAYERYSRIRDLEAGEAWLLARGTVAQPYPVRLAADARPVGSLMEAMHVAAAESQAWPETEAAGYGVRTGPGAAPDAERLERSLRRRIRNLVKRRAALQRQLEGESADDLRNIGHLLLSRQHEVSKGSESVSLEGFDGSETHVRLDPRLDAVQNAERFYDRRAPEGASRPQDSRAPGAYDRQDPQPGGRPRNAALIGTVGRTVGSARRRPGAGTRRARCAPHG